MHLRPAHPLSESEAGRVLPPGRVGHQEEGRVQMILLFLGGSMLLLAVGLIIAALA
jgi:hypothetical protein